MRVREMISGRNENSEPVTCSRRARVSVAEKYIDS